MSVSFHISQSHPSETCVVCRDELTDDVMCHNDVHPVHQKCIKLWLRVNPTCPICRVAINTSTVFSWKDRIINFITPKHPLYLATGIIIALLTDPTPANSVLPLLVGYVAGNVLPSFADPVIQPRLTTTYAAFGTIITSTLLSPYGSNTGLL